MSDEFDVEGALGEMTAWALAGAMPRVLEPEALTFLRTRYREGLEKNVGSAKEWRKLRSGALEASHSLGQIASAVAALHGEFEIQQHRAIVAAAVVESECQRLIAGRVCARLGPLPGK